MENFAAFKVAAEGDEEFISTFTNRRRGLRKPIPEKVKLFSEVSKMMSQLNLRVQFADGEMDYDVLEETLAKLELDKPFGSDAIERLSDWTEEMLGKKSIVFRPYYKETPEDCAEGCTCRRPLCYIAKGNGFRLETYFKSSAQSLLDLLDGPKDLYLDFVCRNLPWKHRMFPFHYRDSGKGLQMWLRGEGIWVDFYCGDNLTLLLCIVCKFGKHVRRFRAVGNCLPFGMVTDSDESSETDSDD